MTTDTPRPPPRRRFFGAWGRRELQGLFWQVLVVGIALGIVAFLWSNTVTNLSARRITTGFAFLGREAGMPIADSLLAYNPRDTYLWAFAVGLANTLRVAVVGIVLATPPSWSGPARTPTGRLPWNWSQSMELPTWVLWREPNLSP